VNKLVEEGRTTNRSIMQSKIMNVLVRRSVGYDDLSLVWKGRLLIFADTKCDNFEI
jgi:hypothetical protein